MTLYISLKDNDFYKAKRIFECKDYKEAKLVLKRLKEYGSFSHFYILKKKPDLKIYKKKHITIFWHNQDNLPQFYKEFDIEVKPSNPFVGKN